jgi:hypothetical protein
VPCCRTTWSAADATLNSSWRPARPRRSPAGTVAVGGTTDAPTFTDAADRTAGTLCGNIPTANATVLIIDTVLMPAA